MQIILVHSRLASARSITIKRRHVAAAIAGLALLVITGAAFLYYLTFRHAAEIRLPILKDLLLVATAEDAMKKDKWVRENISAMAVKLGEMQAQLVRLDALGERVSSLAGIKPSEFNFKELPGRGGPLNLNGARDISIPEFKSSLDKLVKNVDQRNDYLNVVETTLMNNRVANKLLPTILPVNGTYNASGFGWRSDPFTGAQAFHQGIDFIAQTGTPIVAAAGGVVVVAEYHPQYGNMVDVDHGNDLTTRYAHSSRVIVKVGDIVKRGQHIADVGSTGRSTGAHLHFEVHLRGSSMDPNKFLQGGQDAHLAAK